MPQGAARVSTPTLPWRWGAQRQPFRVQTLISRLKRSIAEPRTSLSFFQSRKISFDRSAGDLAILAVMTGVIDTFVFVGMTSYGGLLSSVCTSGVIAPSIH